MTPISSIVCCSVCENSPQGCGVSRKKEGESIHVAQAKSLLDKFTLAKFTLAKFTLA